MKKKLFATVCVTLLTLSMSIPAFAAGWQKNDTGWWWQNDDGSWPANSWQWLDGNNDGVAECYYFNANGYMLANTTTPDGYTVNADGAWTENGTVQTKAVTAQPQQAQNTTQASTQNSSDNMNGYYYPASMTVTTTGAVESHDYDEYVGNIIFEALADGNIKTTYPNNEVDGQPSYVLTKTGNNTYQRNDELGRPMVLTIVDSQTFTLTESDGLFLYTYKKR